MLNRKARKQDLLGLPIDVLINMILDLQDDFEQAKFDEHGLPRLTKVIPMPKTKKPVKNCDEKCECDKDKTCRTNYL